MLKLPSILVYGIGNPGREDDGIGIMLAERIEADSIPGVSVEMNYQLNAEDALTLTSYGTVIFTDATVNPIHGFAFGTVVPGNDTTFTSHSMTPGMVVALCRTLYNHLPNAYILEIKGFSFELQERITPEARHNAERAYDFLKTLLTGLAPVETAAHQAGQLIH